MLKTLLDYAIELLAELTENKTVDNDDSEAEVNFEMDSLYNGQKASGNDMAKLIELNGHKQNDVEMTAIKDDVFSEANEMDSLYDTNLIEQNNW